MSGSRWPRGRRVQNDERHQADRSAASAMVALAIPMSLQAMLSAAVLLIDVLFVAQLGSDAVSAVGWVAALTMLFGVVVNGIGLAITTLVANAWSGPDVTARRDAIAQAVVCTALLSILLPPLGWVLYEPFMVFFGAPEAIVALGERYAAWSIWGYPSVIALFLLNCVMRGAGHPSLALRALIIACTVNILFGPALIFGVGAIPAFGLAGAGAAAVLGRSAGAAYLLWQLTGRREQRFPSLDRIDLKMAATNMQRLASMAVGGTVQTILLITSSLFVLKFAGLYGATAVAGYVVGSRLLGLAILPVNGVATAAAVLAGQNIRCEQKALATAAVRAAVVLCLTLGAALGLVLILAPNVLLWPFALGPAAHASAKTFLVATAAFLLASVLATVMTHVANGVGLFRAIVWVQMIGLFALQIPATLLFVYAAGLGEAGIWIGMGIGQIGVAIGGTLVVRRYFNSASGL